MSTLTRRTVLRATAASVALAAPAAALASDAVTEALPPIAAAAPGPMKGWQLSHMCKDRKNPLIIVQKDAGTWHYATDDEARRFLMENPYWSRKFTPARVRELLSTDYDGPLFALLSELDGLHSPATDDPAKLTRYKRKRARIVKAICEYPAATDAGAAEQVRLVIQSTYGNPSGETLTDEQKRALLQSANNWFLLRWKTDRQMESRAHLARAAAEREQQRSKGDGRAQA
jgi:hypothetical protein